VIVVIAGAMLASLDGTAQAKGDGFFVIRGPGLAHPIVLRDPAEVASFFWGAGTGEWVRMDPPQGARKLGPRYEVRGVYWDTGQPRRTIRQVLYPRAEGGRHGMWVFTPDGQRWYGGMAVQPGWFILSVDAQKVLEIHGFGDGASPPASAGHFRPA